RPKATPMPSSGARVRRSFTKRSSARWRSPAPHPEYTGTTFGKREVPHGTGKSFDVASSDRVGRAGAHRRGGGHPHNQSAFEGGTPRRRRADTRFHGRRLPRRHVYIERGVRQGAGRFDFLPGLLVRNLPEPAAGPRTDPA